MSRAAIGVLLVLACLASDAMAQGRDRYAVLLARATFMRDSLRRADAAARSREMQKARTSQRGPVLVVSRSSDSPETVEAVTSIVWRAFQEFGVFPDSDLAAVALIDELLANTGDTLRGRTAVAFSRPGGLTESAAQWWGKTMADIIADNIIWTASGVLLRDSLSREWLERRLDPRIDSVANSGVVEDLAIGQWPATRGCLGGVPADCATYLGIELVPDYRARFPVATIRALVTRQTTDIRHADPVFRRCVEGDDDACLAIYRPAVAPAGMGARRSFVLFVSTRFGAAAARTVLNGPGSSLGLRVRTATGGAPEVVAAQWREWVLRTGKRQPVEAGLKWWFSAAAAAAALVALGMRSGRWLP